MSHEKPSGMSIKESDSDCEDAFPGLGTMFKYVRKWSNLIQISAFVKVRSMDMPKTMRIFVK